MYKKYQLFGIVGKDLVGHDHDPKQKDGTHEPKGESRLPALADGLLLHPRQRCRRQSFGVLVEHGQIAVAANTAGRSPELNRQHDQAHHPQHKQHEAANHHNRRKQPLLIDEHEHSQDKHNAERADRDEVRKVPRNVQLEALLHLYKRRKDADEGARGGEHDNDPKVELDGRPAVLVDDMRVHVATLQFGDIGVGKSRRHFGGSDGRGHRCEVRTDSW